MAPLLSFLRRPCAVVLKKAYIFEKAVINRALSSSAYAEISKLPSIVQDYVKDKAALCQPDNIHVCDGSKEETDKLFLMMQKEGTVKPLTKYENCWLALTDPKDVARVESKTVISTENKRDTIPNTKNGKPGQLGHWMSPEELDKALLDRFPGSMRGRTMYVIPFSMGPINGPISKNGIQITDSKYVVASMGIMTRISPTILKLIERNNEFVKCMHTIGAPLPLKRPLVNNWPCHPEKVLVSHIPAQSEIQSYGSGYGGNSLLGKKCFALRIGSTIARREGWLAEHMLILGITNPAGVKKYIAAAFPSQCGKTNLAMMEPSVPGWKIECVGDDIAWMKFDANGQLRAINPEYGFFGVAPGTSTKTNPNALVACEKNTVYTNVAATSDGGVYWEGMDEIPQGVDITSWKNEPWTPDSKELAAHSNSRFCCPASQCPTIDPQWENTDGVVIDAIIFGGRRPAGVPLVYESFNWQHGVFVGAAMRSEATSAAEHSGKAIMHDPFAMRPFFGYNFGKYLEHWLSMEKPDRQLPKIYHVNWFRKGADGKFMWPGFGENSRVLEWIFNRTEGDEVAVDTAIGRVPKEGTLDISGLADPVDMKALFDLPKDFWLREVDEIANYFDEQVNEDLPKEIAGELEALKQRVEKM